jgi:putative ABC transport system permease protein
MNDLRTAVRELRAAPVVTGIAILSLALGIGANTAIFSLADALLVRPLPIVEPQRLAVISDTRAVDRGFTESWTYGVWEQIHEHAQPFDGVGAWWSERLNLASHGGEAEPVDALWVSGDFFATLGVPALLGRALSPADDLSGGGRDGAVAVISYDFWQRRFAGAAGVIGTPLVIERVPFTIVGVAPPAFFGAEVGRAFDVAVPVHAETLVRGEGSRIFSRQRPLAALTIMVRLKPGQSIDAATATLRGMQPQIRDAALPASMPPAFRTEFLKDAFVVLPAATGTSRLRTRYERPLVVIFVIVALVLVIACANIANLQLARSIARRHELSVRVALGASRWRLARAWLTESLLLSASGAVLGLLFAFWGSRLIVSQLSTVLNRVYLDLSLDWRVLAFTLAVTVATTIVFGILPAVRASGVAPIEALKEQGRGTTGGERGRLSNGLVVAQVALSVVIVVVAGLFVRTFEKLATVPLGFENGRVLLVNVSVSRARAAESDRVAFVQRLARAIAEVPGVTKTAASVVTPAGGLGLVTTVHVPDATVSGDLPPGGRLGPRNAYVNFITPSWFSTYGTPIVTGRDFTDGDVKGAPPVIIVNQTFVRRFLTGRNPVGATVAFEQGRSTLVEKTVIGVVPDAVYSSVRNADEAVEYAPLTQVDFALPPSTDGVISVRAAGGPPMRLARSLAAALEAADPNVIFGFRSLAAQVDATLTQERLVAMLSGFFGALALLLAGLGLYGVTASGAASRRAEIGIRLALGSTGARVVRLVVSRAAGLVAAGILVGVGISAWACTLVATLLYGVDARDPVTFVGTTATLAMVGTVAAWLPAYRASRLDPAAVLRES